MIVVTRHRVPEPEAAAFQTGMAGAVRALAARPGYVRARLGQAADDPTLWVLTTEWADVGSYRRALSSYEVKMTAVPVMQHAVDEPSAYELRLADG